MTWVNLNNVYLPQAGGTVSGNLAVTGNLTINDKTGKGTTYNVASEITALRDSVSRTIKYFSVADQDDITITAPFNCIIEVDAWYENQWPYGGGSQTLAIQTPSGLTSLAELVGRLIYGDVIGRTLHAFKAFSGGIKNTSYKFQMLPNGGGTNGSRVIIVKCIPIN